MIENENCDLVEWDYLPCVRIINRETSVLISLDDIHSIIKDREGLVEGNFDGFFVVNDDIVSIFQYFPGGAISKKPILSVPLSVFDSVVNDLKRSD